MDSKLEIVLTAKDITGQAFKKLQGRLDTIKKSVFSLQGGLVTLAGGYGLQAVATGALNVASSFEQMQVKLDTLTRGRGRETLQEINQWALEMPVNTMKAVDTFAMMQAMGLDPTIKKMETLVDVASIFGDDAMPRVARAMGQMQSLGKLTAQDLNQMAEVGINARKYLKEAMGMTVEEVQKAGIEIDKIVDVIWKGLDADFAGAAKKAQSSWAGMTATFKSYMVEISRSVMDAGVFEELKNQLADINEAVAAWLETNRELIKVKVPEYIDNVTESVKKLVDVYNAIPAEAVGAAGYGLLGRMLFGPKGALIGVLAYAGYKIGEFITTAGEDVDDNITRLQKRIEHLTHTISSIEDVPGWEGMVEGLRKQLALAEDLLKEHLKTVEYITVPPPIQQPQQPSFFFSSLTVDDFDWVDNWETKWVSTAESIVQNTNGMLQEEMDTFLSNITEGAEMERFAKNIEVIWENTAENIQESMADGFAEIAKSGELLSGDLSSIMQNLGAGITDIATDIASNMTAAYAQMALAAKNFADKQNAAMASTGWGMAAIAAGYMYSQMTDGGGENPYDALEEAIKQLTDELQENTAELKALNLSGIESQWWPEIYDMSRDLANNLSASLGDFFDEWNDKNNTYDIWREVFGGPPPLSGWGANNTVDFTLLPPTGKQGEYNINQEIVSVFNSVTGAIDNYTLEQFAQILEDLGPELDIAGDAFEYIIEQLDNFNDQVESIVKDITGTFDDFVLGITDTRSEIQKAVDEARQLFDESITGFNQLRVQGGWVPQETYDKLENDLQTAIEAIYTEPFQNLLNTIDSTLTTSFRDTWGTPEWQGHINDLMQQYTSISRGPDDDYYDQAIDIAQDTFSAIKSLESINEQQVKELQGLQDGIGDLIENISGGGSLAAVQSVEYYTRRYQDLMNEAFNGSPEAVSDFKQFVPGYLDFMKSYTPNYQAITDDVLRDLNRVQTDIADQMSELDLLNDTNSWLANIYESLQAMLQADIYQIDMRDFVVSPTPYEHINGVGNTPPEPVGDSGYVPTTEGGDSSADSPDPNANDINTTPYSSGGFTGLYGGIVHPNEWVIPTYEPQRSRLLSETGVQAAIDSSISRILPAIAAMDGGGGGPSGPVHIHVDINGREICNVVAQGLSGRHAELVRAAQKNSRGN